MLSLELRRETQISQNFLKRKKDHMVIIEFDETNMITLFKQLTINLQNEIINFKNI